MKIVLVGELELDPDEAMRKTAQKYYQNLNEQYQVKGYTPYELLNPTILKEIKQFDPDVLHFIPGPSIYSLGLTKLVSLMLKNTKIVHSCLHHGFYPRKYGLYYATSNFLKPLLPLVKPDKILTQSNESKRFFSEYGYNCSDIYGGVDTDRFTPVSNEKKLELREKYNIPKEKFVCLHVGSIREWRNLSILSGIPDEKIALLIVGSSATATEGNTEQQIRRGGAIIIDKYIENIEEIFSLSDCYVFPTVEEVGCCDVPLTVLEAMSSNLGIVTTKFGGVTELKGINNNDGIIFAHDQDSFEEGVQKLHESDQNWSTRQIAKEYDWGKICERVIEKYDVN